MNSSKRFLTNLLITCLDSFRKRKVCDLFTIWGSSFLFNLIMGNVFCRKEMGFVFYPENCQVASWLSFTSGPYNLTLITESPTVLENCNRHIQNYSWGLLSYASWSTSFTIRPMSVYSLQGYN